MSTIVILTAIVISGNEIIIITMITKYLAVWNNIDKKILKTSTTAWFSVNIFSENISSWPSREIKFFLMALFQILLLFYKEKTTLPSSNVLLSVMSLVIILLKKFFLPLINFAQRLRCLLYAFLPKSLLAFKKFFFWHRTLSSFLYLFLYSWKAFGLFEHTALLWERVFK